MIPVLSIAYRTDGEHHPYGGVHTSQHLDGLLHIPCTLLYGELLFVEEPLWALLAVIDNLAGLFKNIYVVSAEGKEGDVVRLPLFCQTLYGVQHTDGVIHHTIGVYRRCKLFLGEALPDVVGKATAHKQQSVGDIHPPRWLLYVNLRTKFHDAVTTYVLRLLML